MAGVVDIFNLALANISSTRLKVQAADEASTEAALCSSHYQIALETLLQSNDWNFARAKPKLTLRDNDRSAIWLYCYDFSFGDVLAFRRITDDVEDVGFISDGAPYDIDNGKIYTSLPGAYAVYTKRFDDVTKFRPLFTQALAASLAARIAFPLTKENSVQEKAEKSARMAFDQAVLADANEGFRGRKRIPAHIAARYA